MLVLPAEVPKKQEILELDARLEEQCGTRLRAACWRWREGQTVTSIETGDPLPRIAPRRDTEGRFLSVTEGAEYPYLLYLPERVPEGRLMPVILFLHGIGERGMPPSALAGYGPFQYILSGHGLPFLVAAPVIEKENHWVQDGQGEETDAQMIRLRRFLAQILCSYPADPERICLTGLSMGGRGAYKLSCFLQGTFAALAVCCGRAAPRESPDRFFYRMENLTSLPCWIFHGLKDEVVRPEHSLAAAEKLRRLDGNADVRLTLYPGVGHDCYEYAYRDSRLYAWLEVQKKG